MQTPCGCSIVLPHIACHWEHFDGEHSVSGIDSECTVIAVNSLRGIGANTAFRGGEPRPSAPRAALTAHQGAVEQAYSSQTSQGFYQLLREVDEAAVVTTKETSDLLRYIQPTDAQRRTRAQRAAAPGITITVVEEDGPQEILVLRGDEIEAKLRTVLKIPKEKVNQNAEDEATYHTLSLRVSLGGAVMDTALSFETNGVQDGARIDVTVEEGPARTRSLKDKDGARLNPMRHLCERHILTLAARSGVVVLSDRMFEKSREVLQLYLENVLRHSISVAACTGADPPVIMASHVLAAIEVCYMQHSTSRPASVSTLIGTGRLAALYATRNLPGKQQHSDLDAAVAIELERETQMRFGAHEKGCACDLCDSEADGYIKPFDITEEKAEEGVEEGAPDGKDDSDDSDDSDASDKVPLLTGEWKRNEKERDTWVPSRSSYSAKDAHKSAVKAANEIQKETSPVLHYQALTAMVRELVRNDSKVISPPDEWTCWSLKAEPGFDQGAFVVLRCAIEAYLIGVFEAGVSAAIHAGRVAIEPKDIQLVSRF